MISIDTNILARVFLDDDILQAEQARLLFKNQNLYFSLRHNRAYMGFKVQQVFKTTNDRSFAHFVIIRECSDRTSRFDRSRTFFVRNGIGRFQRLHDPFG